MDLPEPRAGAAPAAEADSRAGAAPAANEAPGANKLLPAPATKTDSRANAAPTADEARGADEPLAAASDIRPHRSLWLLAIAHAVNHAQAVILPLIFLKIIDEFEISEKTVAI